MSATDAPKSGASTHRDAQNRRVLSRLVLVVLVMGGLAWASVPFYRWFCQVTGFGGATVTADQGADTVLTQTMNIRFDASIDPLLPWEFKPVERKMTVKIGETGLAFYEATNTSNRPVAGSAVFNVTPYAAGGYFTKIDCFCFTKQVLQPGETVQMPVSFFVDPEIVNDADAKFVKQITLSYTFYETEIDGE